MKPNEIDQLITQHLGSDYEFSPYNQGLYQDTDNNIRVWSIILNRTEPDGTKKELKYAVTINLNGIILPEKNQFAQVLGIIKDKINADENPTNGFF